MGIHVSMVGERFGYSDGRGLSMIARFATAEL